jgi:hypothetical protein
VTADRCHASEQQLIDGAGAAAETAAAALLVCTCGGVEGGGLP